MAANADIVEEVIATSTDDNPPSRRKVMAAIRPPRRRPLPDEFVSAILSLGTAVSAITRLTGDTRFRPNAASLADQFLNDLLRNRDALTRVVEVLRETAEVRE
jgi:hypothetical protein